MTETKTPNRQKSPEALRSISEVAELLGVEPYVLRFWETRFSSIKPMKLKGGRRYYRPQDVAVLEGIRHLLYEEGYTIKGAKQALNQQRGGKASEFAGKAAPEQKTQMALELEKSKPAHVETRSGLSDSQKVALAGIRRELESLKSMLKPHVD